MSTSSTTPTLRPDKPVETISVERLVAILSKINGASMIAFSALTDARPTKTEIMRVMDDGKLIHSGIGGGERAYAKLPIKEGLAVLRNPHPVLKKLSTVQAVTGIIWENSVNRERDRECKTDAPAFVEGERQWGERISSALVAKPMPEGGSQYYLVAQVLKAQKPVFLAPDASKGGALITVPKSVIEPFIPSHEEVKAEAAAHQGVTDPRFYRNYALQNIVRISVGGHIYRIRRPIAAVAATSHVSVTKPHKPRGATVSDALSTIVH